MASSRTPVNRVVRGRISLSPFMQAYLAKNKVFRGPGARFASRGNTIVGNQSAPSTTVAKGKANG